MNQVKLNIIQQLIQAAESGMVVCAVPPLAALYLQLGTLCLLLLSTVSLSVFKSRLKTHLFTTVYS